MTLHTARQTHETIGEPIEGEMIALPGERAAPPALSGEGEAIVAALPEDRVLDPEARAERSLREQVDRAIASASAALRRQQAPKPAAWSAAIAVANEAGLEAGAQAAPSPGPAAAPAPSKPLWLRPIFLGGASAVAALAVATAVLTAARQPGQVRIAETGMAGEPAQQVLIAPSAQLVTVPKREVVAEATAKPAPGAGKPDALHEFLSFKEPEKHAAKPAAGGAAEAGSTVPAEASTGAPEKAQAGAPTGTLGITEPASADKHPAAGQPETAPRTKGASEEGEKAASLEMKPDKLRETVEPRRDEGSAQARIASVAPEAGQGPVGGPAAAPVGGQGASQAGGKIGAVAAVGADKNETALANMVTELGTLVHKLKADLLQLQAAQHSVATGTESKLSDFERRLSFAEARRALDGAEAVGSASSEEPPPLTVTPAGSAAKPGSAAVKPGAAGGKPGRVLAVKTASAPADPEPQRRYRIQAASPGLAMLGEIDRSGDDGAPLQIGVGSQVPGYGKVKSIDQRGITWVVQTENGPIQ